MNNMHKHEFVPSDKFKDFEVCVSCGTFHSTNQGDPKELYGKDYWKHESGHSTFDEQIYNLTETETCGVSKVDSLIFGLNKRRPVLEIACSPGALLKVLYDNGYDVYGIEPDKSLFGDIWNQCPGAKLIGGYFPDCTKDFPAGSFDHIYAADVFEHCDDYHGFITEIYRLLPFGGGATIMSPIILEDGQYRERDFLPSEHCYIHTEKFLKEFLAQYFSVVEFTRWQVGHEIIKLTK